MSADVALSCVNKRIFSTEWFGDTVKAIHFHVQVWFQVAGFLLLLPPLDEAVHHVAIGSRQQKKQQEKVAGAEDATMADFAGRVFKELKPLASSCVLV
ncbi:hypothetical protein [Xanthomonas sacchari]|uniref:hypothetical protein n=1 Tax=Xanthomonas sacchari TaxID=56458 RepID=UPI00225E0BA4|nr:hypothetical protein [Xanthomonas sacchari]